MTDKGFTDTAKGKVKEVAGDITNDNELKAEGFIDQSKGKLKKTAGDIKDATEEIKDKVKEKFEDK